MATYSASVLSTAGSTTLPLAALVGSTSARLYLREMGIFNTTTTAVDIALCRLSTAGTPGSSATTATETESAAAATGVLKGTYTSTAPTSVVAGRRAMLGGAIGSGIVWTFPNGLAIPATTAAAVGVIIGAGTGQACIIYTAWDEG